MFLMLSYVTYIVNLYVYMKNEFLIPLNYQLISDKSTKKATKC